MRSLPTKQTTLRLAAGTAATALVIVTLARCANSNGPSATRTLYGTPVAMGQGSATGYVRVDAKGKPVSVGVQLTPSALNGLPLTHMTTEFRLSLPVEVAPTGVDHIVLNWNPHGHPPTHIYTVPHFDVHLYMISEARRVLIGPSDPQWVAKVANKPTGDLIPAGYIADPFGIPRMGVHWADHTTNEWHGKGFTSTFIYGSYDGQFTFYEPMIALAFLESQQSMHFNIGVAARYAQRSPPNRLEA